MRCDNCGYTGNFNSAMSGWGDDETTYRTYTCPNCKKVWPLPETVVRNDPFKCQCGFKRTVGALVSGEAVVDVAFRTTDVLVMLPVQQITGRYINHYGADASRFAA